MHWFNSFCIALMKNNVQLIGLYDLGTGADLLFLGINITHLPVGLGNESSMLNRIYA